MREKLNAEETLEYLICVIKENLNELYGTLPLCADAHFVHGEKTAYVECLEILQFWEKAEDRGLSGAVEREYPI